jgi:hypothetical protein
MTVGPPPRDREPDRPRPEDYPIVVPWITVVVVAGAAPLIAGGLAALISRGPTSTKAAADVVEDHEKRSQPLGGVIRRNESQAFSRVV